MVMLPLPSISAFSKQGMESISPMAQRIANTASATVTVPLPSASPGVIVLPVKRTVTEVSVLGASL